MTDTQEIDLPGKATESAEQQQAVEATAPVAAQSEITQDTPATAEEVTATPETGEETAEVPVAPEQAQPAPDVQPEEEALEPEPAQPEDAQPEDAPAEEPKHEVEEPQPETEETPATTEDAQPEAAEPQPEAEATPTEAEVQPAPARKPVTQEEILARLTELAEGPAEAVSKAEIDGLKQAFYRQINAAREAARQEHIEAGGAEEDFTPEPDPQEEAFKTVMAALREKRNAANAQLEKQKEENLQLKLAIIEQIRQLVEAPQDPNKQYAHFKQLQQQWNEIKAVPQAKANEVWKSYRLYVEKFYDLLKLNSEFRKLDFKKNLEAKERICATAERLAEDPDVVSAFHQLQKLHQQFREVGPVAKELREQVWARFKAASTAINRRHQQHFEELKEAEQTNLDQKTVICEIVEAINYDELKTFAAWESKTKEVIALQAKWKTVGFAPQKMNNRIFERFRRACDEFFRRKSEFFKVLKDGMNDNLERKRALCERAEALKDSTDWRTTAAELQKLQKEWKTIGPVAKKHSDAVWKRFITACDYFYDQKNKATSSQRSEEQENLARKREVIRKLEAIDEDADSREGQWQVGDLVREWNSIGHVPFKEKDKLYKQYRAIVDELSDRFGSTPRRSSGYRQSYDTATNSGQPVNRERERLVRIYENMKAELQTYENNLGFLTFSSKRGSSLLDELKGKVDKLKADIEEVKQKIQAMDDAAEE